MDRSPTTPSGIPLWVVGVTINILGSVTINLGQNLIKVSHADKELRAKALEAERTATATGAGAGGSSIELSSSAASVVRRGSQSREPLNAAASASSGGAGGGGVGVGTSPVLHLDPAALEEDEDASHYLEGHIIDGGHDDGSLATCTSKLDAYQHWLGGLVGRGLRLFNLSPRNARVTPTGEEDGPAVGPHRRWEGDHVWQRRPLSSYLTLGDRPVRVVVREKVREGQWTWGSGIVQ